MIEEFARREYPHLVKVDFLRDQAASVALSYVQSGDEAVEAIGILRGSRLVPGETPVFFDEVQEAPNIVTLSKYLMQDGRFDLAMSGSLLGIELRKVRSLPVGHLHSISGL